jgi:hypothetical protein
MKTSSMVAASLIACAGVLGICRPWHAGEKAGRRQAMIVPEGAGEEASSAPPRRVVRALPAPAEDAPSPPAGDDVPAKPPSKKPAPVSPREAFAGVRAAFDAQPTDRAWAPGAEQTLRGKVSDVLPAGASLRSAECRTSMCRVEVKLATDQDRRRFRASAFTELETHVWDGPFRMGPLNEDDPSDPSVVAYLYKPGQPLAPP